jgi:uncharacterized protein YdeI (YjbR/CyaY-like superfamily)
VEVCIKQGRRRGRGRRSWPTRSATSPGARRRGDADGQNQRRSRDVKPHFFPAPDDFRAWLEQNHSTASEVVVGFHKKDTGRASMTWTESVREALCFGWIDGIRRSLGDESYTIRFTPRKPRSIWSARNVRHVDELIRAGRMTPAGLAAFEARTPGRTGIYSFEQRHEARLRQEQEERFRADAAAWEFFQAQPPSYRKTAIYWVVSAKREETQSRRLAKLIEDSAAGRRLAQLTPPRRPGGGRHNTAQ